MDNLSEEKRMKKLENEKYLAYNEATLEDQKTRLYKKNQYVTLKKDKGGFSSGSVGVVNFVLDRERYGGQSYYDIHFYKLKV